METKGLNKFISFIFFYILIIFPLALFTKDEIFPFSTFPMYARNASFICGYTMHLHADDQRVLIGQDRGGVANLFLKYSRSDIARSSSSNTEMCQFIRQVFWPKQLPFGSFYVMRYCTDVKELPQLIFDEKKALSCQ